MLSSPGCPWRRGNTPEYQPCRGAACGKRRQCCSQTRDGAGKLLLWRLQLCLFRQNWIPIAAAGFGSRTARAFAAFSHGSWLAKASLRVLTSALLPSPGLWWPRIHKWTFCDKRVFVTFSYPVPASTGGRARWRGWQLAVLPALGDQGRGLCARCHYLFPDLLAAGKSLELRSAASRGVCTGMLPRLQGEKRVKTVRKLSFKFRWAAAVFGDAFCIVTRAHQLHVERPSGQITG